MKRITERRQQTIARPTEVHGIGFITGKNVRLRFRPAQASTGVVFVRTDLGPQACISAHVNEVTGTARRTTIGHDPISVGLIEHVLAALSGLRIDNCIVELNAPEPPGLDGSALGFVNALLEAGTVMQCERRPVWATLEPIVVESGGASIALHPLDSPELRISYLLDHGANSPICWQIATETITAATFVQKIAPCRTFVTQAEAIALRNQGIGSRTAVTDLVVFGDQGPIDNHLRFANEPARHKILDIIGDLSLLGCDLRGHIVAYRTGHPHNVELARMLSRRVQQGFRRPCMMQAA